MAAITTKAKPVAKAAVKPTSKPVAKPMTKGLGKGLGALLAAESLSVDMRDAIIHLPIGELNPNIDQPRKYFDKERLQGLADSIRQNGVIQPIIVTRFETGYRIVAGERRWRAARIAGLREIPAIVRELTDVQVLEQALIENIQRQDLNPIEEAQALDKLMKDHGMTQERLATMIGRSRPAIANTIRLLQLNDILRQLVIEESLSAGHARALLGLPTENLRNDAAKIIVTKELNVRQTETLVKTLLKPRKRQLRQETAPEFAMAVKDLEHKLQSCLGTKVLIQDKRSRGKIVIDYYSYDDLDRILAQLGVPGSK